MKSGDQICDTILQSNFIESNILSIKVNLLAYPYYCCDIAVHGFVNMCLNTHIFYDIYPLDILDISLEFNFSVG